MLSSELPKIFRTNKQQLILTTAVLKLFQHYLLQEYLGKNTINCIYDNQ